MSITVLLKNYGPGKNVVVVTFVKSGTTFVDKCVFLEASAADEITELNVRNRACRKGSDCCRSIGIDEKQNQYFSRGKRR